MHLSVCIIFGKYLLISIFSLEEDDPRVLAMVGPGCLAMVGPGGYSVDFAAVAEAPQKCS